MTTLSDLTAAHKRRLDALRAVTTRRTTNLFARSSTPTDASASRFVADTVPLVLAAQAAAVDMVDAYLSTYAGIATGTSTRPVGLDPTEIIGAKARNGTFLETVYRRPFWQWQRDGNRDAAAARITTDVLTDIQLAQRDATWARMQVDERLPRWRRVTAGSSCQLCTAAATRTYRNINQVHIHPGCDCTVEPVVDPAGAGPDPSKLPAIYRQLSDLRIPIGVTAAGVAVHEHGELGPTLAVPGHEFA